MYFINIIYKFYKFFNKAREYKFSSGGREDVDVRMLGNGRPFVIEFCDPKKTALFYNDPDKDMKL